MKKLNAIIKKIKRAKSIALFCHKEADIDSVGSALAMYEFLEILGKSVDMFLSEQIDDRFKFLKNSDKFKSFEDLSDCYDLLISLDCANELLLGKFTNYFMSHNNTINIDHHKDNSNYAKLNFVDNVSANCVNIYNILSKIKFKVTLDIANFLYSGIIGDTSNFTNLNTDSMTLKVASNLVEFGVNTNELNYQLFNKVSLNKFLFSNYLKSRVKVYNELGVAVLKCTKNDVEKFNASIDDIGAVTSSPLSIDCVNICLMLSERDDCVKCSFRSKKDYNINIIAKEFGGGGHIYASACTSDKYTIDEFENEIIKFINNNIDKIKII